MRINAFFSIALTAAPTLGALFPANIDLVVKNYDKLVPAMPPVQ
jgi:hypothetical protein